MRKIELLNNAGAAFTPGGDFWTANHVGGRYEGYLVLVRVFGFRRVGDRRKVVLVDQRFERCPKAVHGVNKFSEESPVFRRGEESRRGLDLLTESF